MTVTVKLFGYLRKEGMDVGQANQVEVASDSTAGDLASQLELVDYKLIFVNNVFRGNEHPLADGDEVIFFPAMAGG